MAPSSSPSTSTSSKPSKSPTLPPFRSHHFTPIQEEEENEVNEERQRAMSMASRSTRSSVSETIVHHPTPVQKCVRAGKRSESDVTETDENTRSVSCNNCRPSNREKTTTVVPMASPNGIMKSIVSTLSRKSPRLSGSSSSEADTTRSEEQWKIAVAVLSQKLMQATRKRDEASLEATRAKSSMVDLEKKLNRLELYCTNLKSGLEICSAGQNPRTTSPENYETTTVVPKFFHYPLFKSDEHDKVIEDFLVSVSDARKSVRVLSRALTLQLRQMGGKVTDRITILLQPYDVKISVSKNPREGVLFYLEALLNLAFFEDFESARFAENSTNGILNPIDRCEAKYGSYNVLRDLTWEEVLTKGTRHFDEEFSGFCDRKMSKIVALLGWNKAWPEQLLHAFFGASKSVWLVHLLANSVHPTLPIFRVDKGAEFASVYMEDMGADKARKLVPSTVRIMVAPGFYVYDNVVKCKVLCRYHNHYNTTIGRDDFVANGDLVDKGVVVDGSYSIENLMFGVYYAVEHFHFAYQGHARSCQLLHFSNPKWGVSA
ncbi:IRK-interacting protein-like protein [Drosera capensis]